MEQSHPVDLDLDLASLGTVVLDRVISISGSVKMTNGLPLPVFVRSPVRCRAGFIRSQAAATRPGRETVPNWGPMKMPGRRSVPVSASPWTWRLSGQTMSPGMRIPVKKATHSGNKQPPGEWSDPVTEIIAGWLF